MIRFQYLVDAAYRLGRRARVPLACVLMMLCGAAYADDSLQGFKGVRTITQTTSSSSCIGQPRTPLCAVETFLACGTRFDLRLCEMVGIGGLSTEEDRYDKQYKFLSASYLTQDDVARIKEWEGAPGDVKISINIQYCISGHCPEARQMEYVLRKFVGGWAVFNWRGDEPEYVD